ncbi:MAG: T9SS type A sorting domain-containing protein [Bacteroidetes bacterium]|nr:T9SS type A sorting domain-containing protein [Bacteroidota bacterium]
MNTTVPNHIETFNGQDILQANGNGNVAIRTLLPLNSTTTRIGGTGYEFYVDGINYPLGITPDTIHTTPGAWRIEVAPTTIIDSLVFLHTIDIGDNLNASVAGGIAQQNAYTIGVDWTNTLFFFNAVGDTNALYQVMNNVAGSRTVKIFGADLVPSQVYDVLVDNAVVNSLNTDSVGVLETTILLSAGNHKVEINNTTTFVPSINNNAVAIIVSPNPTKNELNIITNNLLNAEIEISNLMGELLIKTTNTSKIDVSGLSIGVYILHVKQGYNTYNYKFVKE